MEANLKELILKEIEQYKELTSLSEGHYDYMIPADRETLEEISEQIIKIFLNNG